MRRPKLLVTLVLALSLLAAWQLPLLRIDNTAETWLPADSPGLRDLASFRARFGADSPLLAYVAGENLARPSHEWRRLVAELRGIPGIAAVFPPLFVEDDALGPAPPLRQYLASPDVRHAAVAILVQPDLPLAARSRLVERIESTLALWRYHLGEFRIAGADVITYDLDVGSRQSLGSLAPIVFLVMCAVLYAATREWRGVVAALLVISLANLWTVGLLSFFQRPLNLVVATLPAMLAVVGVMQAMHIVAAFHALPLPGHAASLSLRQSLWREAIKETFSPSLYCVLTTSAGFVSLGSSEIPPVRDFGLFTAVGVLLTFALNFSLLPWLLSLHPRVLPRALSVGNTIAPSGVKAYTDWLGRFRTPILALASLIFLLSLAGLARLRVESHILDFFPSQHRVPQNYRTIERHLLGLTPIEVVVEGDRRILLRDTTLETYRQVFEDTLRAEPLARQIVSILLAPAGGARLAFTVAPPELRQALAEEGLPEGVQAFLHVDADQYALRTTILASTASSNAVQAFAERLRERLRKVLPAGASATVTGSSALLIEGQVLLLRTQIVSFASALLVVSVAIYIAFRSVFVSLLAILPNLLPVALTLGAMGFAGIPLNTATVTVAGIALGLVVDDTIHFLHHWLRARRLGLAPAESVMSCLDTIARPALAASLSIAAGFGVFAFSPFPPTALFGLLIAMAALMAIAFDLVFLPALLLRVRRAL